MTEHVSPKVRALHKKYFALRNRMEAEHVWSVFEPYSIAVNIRKHLAATRSEHPENQQIDTPSLQYHPRDSVIVHQ